MVIILTRHTGSLMLIDVYSGGYEYYNVITGSLVIDPKGSPHHVLESFLANGWEFVGVL